MPADAIYWSPLDLEEESLQEMKHYVDPWDLENYAYIRHHLDSVEASSGPSSASFSYVPVQNYPAYDEIRRYEKPKRLYSEGVHYRDRDGFESEFEENPYEVAAKDVSISYAYEHMQKDKWRRSPPTKVRHPRDRSLSFSYGDYGTNQEVYCRLEEIRPQRETTLPIYDDVRRKPRNFGLSNYGHLKIDYSYSWNNLDRYIYH